jgi:hypothetical protein
MIASSIKIHLFDSDELSGQPIGKIELKFINIEKAVSIINDILRPEYNNLGMPLSFKMYIEDLDL